MTQLRTAQQIAEQLQVPATFVYRLAREGAIPVVQLGRYKRFDQVAIDQWIESRLQPVNDKLSRKLGA